MALPIARPGLVAVGLLVAVVAWNDFAGALVLIQRPEAFPAPLALTTFSSFYATNEGLGFVGLTVMFVLPLVVLVVLQRSFVEGRMTGTAR